MLVRTLVLSCPRGPGLVPGGCESPGVKLRCWEKQAQGRPASSPDNSVSFQALGMAATGTEATQQQLATVSVCFSLSELGKKLQFSSCA